jgi:hypothetical protein
MFTTKTIPLEIKFKSINPELTDEYMFVKDCDSKRVLVNLTKLTASLLWLIVPVLVVDN